MVDAQALNELKAAILNAGRLGCPSGRTELLLSSANTIFKLRTSLKVGNLERISQLLTSAAVQHLCEEVKDEVGEVEAFFEGRRKVAEAEEKEM